MAEIIFKLETDTATVPSKATVGAAGFDFSVDFGGWGNFITLYPQAKAWFPLGVSVALPTHTYMRMEPRSGMASKHGIGVLGGVFDSDFRGEISIMLINHGTEKVEIKHGDRIVQGMVIPLERVNVVVNQQHQPLPPTERGKKGLGSTGR